MPGRPQIEQGLPDNRHLARLGRPPDHDILAVGEHSGESIAVTPPSGKGFPGDRFVKYEW